ncbi:MAG: hypothetical protein WD423_09065 [Rhodothermales bacterium]
MLRIVALRCTAILLLLLAAPALAQEAEEDRAGLLNVFIDCDTFLCDFDYFRTEMPFVNYVRDRQDADVHVLLTSESTGGGGRRFTIAFIGQGPFEQLEETLTHTSEATATNDEIRAGITQVFRAGLLRYISRTPLLSRFEFRYEAPADEGAQTVAAEDPWNFWVFNTRVNAFANGEDRYQVMNLSGSASAGRVTEASKFRFSLSGSRRTQTFELSDGTETVDIQGTYGADGLAVASLGPHWSAGARVFGTRSTRLNYDLQFIAAPAIEYNLFPYSESTRKLLTLQYSLGVTHFNYADTTIFNRMEETRFGHRMESVVSVKQPWGNVGVSLDGTQYFFDLSKFNLGLGGSVQFRLFRGFTVNGRGNVSFVRDQLYLPKGDASDEDVLLRRRQLETNWRYFFSFGIGYQFGSKFNNVVNPRFGGGSGNSVIFF